MFTADMKSYLPTTCRNGKNRQQLYINVLFDVPIIKKWLIRTNVRHLKLVEILVFIQKDGIPVATAELFAKNRIGQFYADEHSGTPEGSKPSEEVQHVFTTWLRDKPDLLKHVKKHVKLAEVA